MYCPIVVLGSYLCQDGARFKMAVVVLYFLVSLGIFKMAGDCFVLYLFWGCNCVKMALGSKWLSLSYIFCLIRDFQNG